MKNKSVVLIMLVAIVSCCEASAQGGSEFTSSEDWSHGPYYGNHGNVSVYFADVTGDGKADAIVVNSAKVTVRRSDGSQFTPNEDWTKNRYYGSRGIFFADVTGDGKADAIVVNDDTVTVRRSDGSRFTSNEDWSHGPYYGNHGNFSVYFADVTGDGKADAIVVNSAKVTVRRSDGSQFIPNEDWTKNPYYGSRGTFFADVTGDGKADAIVVNDDTVTVRRSDGSRFTSNEDWSHGPYYGNHGDFSVYFADVTGDGKADAIVVNSAKVTVRRSEGSQFTPNEDGTKNPYYGSRGTFFADATGDGEADAIVVNDDTVTVRRSDVVSVSQQELTGGTPSSVPSWVVEIASDASSCSASVVSEHYLLTAAHCAPDSDLGFGDVVVTRASAASTRQRVYNGRAQFVTHRDYDRGALFDAEDDIALVHLLDGGINLSLTGRAKIYIDYESPIWTRPNDQLFTYAGWGLADSMGDAQCASGTAGVLRIVNGVKLWRASRDQKDMTAWAGSKHTCPGDSGSPWLFARAGDFLAFAVTKGRTFHLGGDVAKATSIFPKLAWIYSASQEGGCNKTECWVTLLECTGQGNRDDLRFLQCFERKVDTGAPPNPGFACPGGQHCCESDGDRCLQCIPRDRPCP